MTRPEYPVFAGKRVIISQPAKCYTVKYGRHRAKKGPRKLRTYSYRIYRLVDKMDTGEIIESPWAYTMNQATYNQLLAHMEESAV